MIDKKEGYLRLVIAVTMFVNASIMPNAWSIVLLSSCGVYSLITGLLMFRKRC
jgi:hypothetical protein